jgi:protein SCO1/2
MHPARHARLPAVRLAGRAYRRRRRLIRAFLLVVAGGLALSLVARAYLPVAEDDRGQASSPATPAAIGGPFTLRTADGSTVTDRDYRGRWLLIYFGYTYCPDVCPTTLADIAQALAALGPLAARLQPLFITVDPARDTPEVIGSYARSFDPRVVGLTGTPAEIERVARAFKVYYSVQRTGDGPGDYLLDHSAFLYVMRPDGRFAGMLDGRDGPGLAAALRRFLADS